LTRSGASFEQLKRRSFEQIKKRHLSRSLDVKKSTFLRGRLRGEKRVKRAEQYRAVGAVRNRRTEQ